MTIVVLGALTASYQVALPVLPTVTRDTWSPLEPNMEASDTVCSDFFERL